MYFLNIFISIFILFKKLNLGYINVGKVELCLSKYKLICL